MYVCMYVCIIHTLHHDKSSRNIHSQHSQQSCEELVPSSPLLERRLRWGLHQVDIAIIGCTAASGPGGPGRAKGNWLGRARFICLGCGKNMKNMKTS